MIHRAGLVIASLAAALVLAVALAAAGFAPVSTPQQASATLAAPAVAAAAPPVPAATPEVKTQYDDIYVRPAPSPKTIVVHKAAPAPIVVSAPASGGEREGGESEGGEGD